MCLHVNVVVVVFFKSSRTRNMVPPLCSSCEGCLHNSIVGVVRKLCVCMFESSYSTPYVWSPKETA